MIVLMFACTQPDVVQAGGVSIALSTFEADPWAGTDTMRVVVLQGDHEVAHADGIPGEKLELPDLHEFGEVTIQVLGLAGATVLSAGSTGPMVVGPGRTASVEVVFLSVNTAVRVPGDVAHARSGGVAIRGLDGRIRFWGGRDAATSPTNDGDVFTFANGFTSVADVLPTPVSGAARVTLPGGETWVAGGDAQAGVSTHAFSFDPYGLPDIDLDGGVPIASPCVASIGWDRAAILGTSANNSDVTFAFTAPDGVVLATSPPTVAACGGLPDGRVVTAGDENAWGILDVEADTFAPFASPLVLDGTTAIDDGDTVWFVGGSDGDITFGRGIPVTAAGPGRGLDALVHPRAWAAHVRGDANHEIVFGGFADAGRTTPVHAVEWWEIGGGSVLAVDVPMARPIGVVLQGGPLLLRGVSDNGPAAYLVMPWLDP